MDPSLYLLDSLDQAASTGGPSAQDVLVHASTTIASPEQGASQCTPSAPPELIAPECTMSAPADDGATDKVAIEVSASPEVVRLPR